MSTTDTPTSTWTVKSANGGELARVTGSTVQEATAVAALLPNVAASITREGGVSLRRLLKSELSTRVFIVSFMYEGADYRAPVRVDEANDTIKDALCRALALDESKTTVTDIA